MKFEKIISFFLFFVIIIILNSVIIYADVVGCCTNPGAGLRLCYDQRLVYRDGECCPSQDESPSYYKSDDSPFGPENYDDCVANFFYVNEACSGIDDCKTGCCCEPLKAATKTEAECKGTGVTFYEGESDCSGVCTLPECSDGVDNDNNGCNDFPDDTGCKDAYDDSESGGICEVVGAGCDSVSYTPELTNLKIKHIKGEKRFSLNWDDECKDNVIFYEIFRCKGNNCNDFELIAISLSEEFTDDSSDLLFGEEYNYRIKAHYSVQIAEPTVEGEGNLGDLECWHKKDYTKFCIHRSYYNQYRDYLIKNFEFTDTNFEEKVSEEFSARFNAPYYCNDVNKLVVSGEKCGGGYICVVEDNVPKCVEKPVCNYEAANPFGLYFEKQLCENKYCFYDRSFSIADSCFACSPEMSCYDYKSKESCEGDNCNIGSCGWRYLSEELGTGVCIGTNEDNCKWCDKTGSEDVESRKVTNKVFEGCTKNKAEKLSVENYKCYFKDGAAKSCKDVICTSYGEEDCNSGQIGLSNTNEISSPSNDHCGIEVCQLFGSNCKKNADGDTKADCENEDCEKDHYRPDTTITPIIDRGVYKSLIIQIFDKASADSTVTLRTSNDYKTYLCKDCSGGHAFDTYTNSYKLIISDLNVFDSGTGNRLLVLNEGANTIRYYSEDPSKNVGLVKNLNVEAYGNISGPIVYRVNVTGATRIGDTYYTNIPKPKITVEFYEDVFITHASLVNNENKARIGPSYSKDMAKSFVFEFSDALGEGDYTFELNAKNKNNIYMDKTYLVHIFIDDTLPILTIEPEKGALIKEKSFVVKLTFDKEVGLESILINNGDFTTKFSSGDNIVFTATLSLEDGNKVIEVNAKDYAGNEIQAFSDFIVNTHALVINIREPSYGVAPAYTFDVVVESDNNANCRYSFNDNLEYEFMDSFEITGGVEHKITGFNKIPDGSKEDYFFYVTCEDEIYGLGNSVFKLRVDTTPPKIETAYAFPSPVVEKPAETTLNVKTDEVTICKYSKTERNYGLMEDKFPGFEDGESGFRTVHKQSLSLPDTGSVVYYLGCENLAGLNSEIKQIDIRIDPTLPLIITDHTSKYSNSTTISLAIETNKKAQCKYSKDENVDVGNIFGPVDYKHVKIMTLSEGKHKFYVKCKDKYLGKWSGVTEIEFTIDTSEPVMDYVDDSSTLENPEVTWMVDRLRVKWLAKDNDTGIHHYMYTLEEFGSLKTILNWTINSVSDEWLWVTGNGGLNLSDGVKYYFRVKARNIVGLLSEVMESNGVSIDINAMPTDCSNKVEDPAESDVDCGGPCEPCENGKQCSVNIDCKSGYCENGVCKATACDDNTWNGEESDVDCGGDVCNKCVDGKKCNQNNDCKSNYCSFGSCKADTCYDNELSGSESDVDCGGACPTKCSEGRHCDVDDDCVLGARCVDALCKICAADDANCNGIPDDRENDRDGDGMDDTWELEHGFDPNNPDDALLDYDEDGLTNAEEFRYGTDPNNADTDGDKHSDKREIEKGTDPLDPDSKPKSKIWFILFMLLLGILVGVAVFVVYHRIVLKRKIKVKPARPIPRFVHRPVTPVRRGPTAEQIRQMRMREIQKKREEEKKKKREKVFDVFGGEKKKGKGKEAKRGVKKVEKKKEVVKKTKPDTFAKLSKLAGKPKQLEKPKIQMSKEDVFAKLSRIAGKPKQLEKLQVKKEDLKKVLTKEDMQELRRKYPRIAGVLLDKKYPKKLAGKVKKKKDDKK